MLKKITLRLTDQLIFMTNDLRRIAGELHNPVHVLCPVSESYKRHLID